MNIDNLTSKKTTKLIGPIGDVTPEVQQLHDETAGYRDQAQTFAGQTVENLDTGVSTLIQNRDSQTFDALGIGNHFRGKTPTRTVLIASSEAEDDVKAVADYVCTGTDDQIVINSVLAAYDKRPLTILLSEGRFYINQWTDAPSGRHFGIYIPTEGSRRTVTIRGAAFPIRSTVADADGWHFEGTRIVLTQAAHAAIPSSIIGYDSSGRYTVLGADLGWWPGRALLVEDLSVEIPDNLKSVVCFDGNGFCACRFLGCAATTQQGPKTSQPESIKGCCGFMGLRKGMYPVDYTFERCYAVLMRDGFVVTGAHAIYIQCSANWDYTSYHFYGSDGYGTVSHGPLLIGCSQERCVKYLEFDTSDGEQTVDIIKMTGEIDDIGLDNYKIQRLGQWAIGGRWNVHATYEWYLYSSGKATRKYDLIDFSTTADKSQAWRLQSTMLNYPTRSNSQTDFFAPGTDRLTLPPVGTQVWYKPLVGDKNTLIISGAWKGYFCWVSAATGEAMFEGDRNAILASTAPDYPAKNIIP